MGTGSESGGLVALKDKETGDPSYVNRLLDSARQGINGRSYLVPGSPPAGSIPLPRR